MSSTYYLCNWPQTESPENQATGYPYFRTELYWLLRPSLWRARLNRLALQFDLSTRWSTRTHALSASNRSMREKRLRRCDPAGARLFGCLLERSQWVWVGVGRERYPNINCSLPGTRCTPGWISADSQFVSPRTRLVLFLSRSVLSMTVLGAADTTS